jgi:DHA1 family tetracycline resistance protein-like MFS transporter
MSAAGHPPADRAALAIVYLTVFIDLLGFGIILPSLPYYARDLGATGLGLGILFSAYSAAQLAGSALLGRLSDRHGRRPILLLSLAGSAASMFLSGLATGLLALSLARALAGAFGGSIGAAQAYIADVTPRPERARYMGLLGASIGVGFVLGPALGAGLLALGFGFRGAAFAAGGLAALNFVSALVRLPESRPSEADAERRHVSAAGWWRTVSRPGLLPLYAAVFLATFAFVALETTLVFLAKDRFALDNRHFGLVLAYLGVVVIAIQGGAVGWLSRRLGERAVAVAGTALMGAALAALPAAPRLLALLLLLGLVAAGQGLASPALATLVSHASEGGAEHGALLGASQSLAALARAIGPVIAGQLYDLHAAAPYVTGGALSLLAASLLRGVARAQQRAGGPTGLPAA